MLFAAGTPSRLFPGGALGAWGPGMLGQLQESQELSSESHDHNGPMKSLSGVRVLATPWTAAYIMWINEV